jgi:hypothetical protein
MIMISIGETLVSEDILKKKFVCELSACKGECCIAGDSGAPLDQDELDILEEIYPKVKPYMSEDGIKAVEEQGPHVVDSDGDLVTPLIDGHRECAYVYFDHGIAKCAIEKAYYNGDISWKKPVSCHLYPVRLTKMRSGVIAVNYEKWDVCKSACSNGKDLNVKVYRFLREPLIRKFGEQWFSELEEVDEALSR